jgi:hypothetical protein
MQTHPSADTTPRLPLIPPVLTGWLALFRPYFTAPTFQHVLVLVAGAVLAPGKRTVTQVLPNPCPQVISLTDRPKKNLARRGGSTILCPSATGEQEPRDGLVNRDIRRSAPR